MSLRRFMINSLQNIFYRAMMPYWQSRFSPYIGEVVIGDVTFHFFYGTPLSSSWYNPIKAHAMTEYIWIQQNLDLANKNIIDAGAHHGHYSSYLCALGGKVTAVEPLSGNIDLIKVNSALNQFDIQIVPAAIADHPGQATFIPRSNGKLFHGVGITVPVMTLTEVNSNASIVKLDVEGAEFRILPSSIEMMPSVSVWIIECHARAGSIYNLALEFIHRGFRVSYLEKKSSKVIPFRTGDLINDTTTIFCLK